MKQNANPVDTSNITVSIKHNRDTSWNMPRYHFHQAMEIYYSLSDNIKFFVSDKIFNVTCGDLFVFNQTDLHRSVAPGNIKYERYVIYFNPDFVNDLSTPSTDLLGCFTNRDSGFSHCVHLTELQSERLLYLIKKMEYYSCNHVYGNDIHKKIALTEILLYVNSLYKTSTIVTPSKNDKDFEKIAPILRFIQRHLSEGLSLKRLSGEFYMSRSYLSTLFKKASGFSINEYIIHRRILLASELLKKGIPVMNVCHMSGFNNLSHFIRTFSSMMHISPKQYAKRNI
jgi:AraC-like DNA-binding protein